MNLEVQFKMLSCPPHTICSTSLPNTDSGTGEREKGMSYQPLSCFDTESDVSVQRQVDGQLKRRCRTSAAGVWACIAFHWLCCEKGVELMQSVHPGYQSLLLSAVKRTSTSDTRAHLCKPSPFSWRLHKTHRRPYHHRG